MNSKSKSKMTLKTSPTEKWIPMRVENSYKLKVTRPDGRIIKIKKKKGDIIWSKE